MMVDTTVYGYMNDGGVTCPDCTGPEDDASANRLYSLDDTEPEGLSCDGCGKYIFEPDYDGLWTQAIEDILSSDDHKYTQARRILTLFEDAGFLVEQAGNPDA